MLFTAAIIADRKQRARKLQLAGAGHRLAAVEKGEDLIGGRRVRDFFLNPGVNARPRRPVRIGVEKGVCEIEIYGGVLRHEIHPLAEPSGDRIFHKADQGDGCGKLLAL